MYEPNRDLHTQHIIQGILWSVIQNLTLTVMTNPTYTHIQVLRPGMNVLGNFRQEGVYYPGKLHAVNGEKCTIHYEDDDVEVVTSRDIFLAMEPMKKKRRLPPETLVLVHYTTPQHRYEVGRVTATHKNDVTVELLGEDNRRIETFKRNKVTVGELG